jgi:hypothetical protein
MEIVTTIKIVTMIEIVTVIEIVTMMVFPIAGTAARTTLIATKLKASASKVARNLAPTRDARRESNSDAVWRSG